MVGDVQRPLIHRKLTKRLIHQAYRVFVDLTKHRRQFDSRNLEADVFGRKVQECSQCYLKIIESGCRAMERCVARQADDFTGPMNKDASTEHFTFRAAWMLWELYDIVYRPRTPIIIPDSGGFASRAGSVSYARDILHWCHHHVTVTDEEALINPGTMNGDRVWDNICKCLVQGHLIAALTLLEYTKIYDKAGDISYVNELLTRIRELWDGDLQLTCDEQRYAQHKKECRQLVGRLERESNLDGEKKVAGVLAGEEQLLQHYSRHWVDLMLARLLFVDPVLGQDGYLEALWNLDYPANHRGAKRPACTADEVQFGQPEEPWCIFGQKMQSDGECSELIGHVFRQVQVALSLRSMAFAPPMPRQDGEDPAALETYQIYHLAIFCKKFMSDGGWFMAHLCDLLDHYAAGEGRKEDEEGPQRADAAHYIEELSTNLAASPTQMWELATNYFRFCCEGQDGHGEGVNLGEQFAIETLLHQPLTTEKLAWKAIHIGRHISPNSLQLVKSDVGKTMAARHWPLTRQEQQKEEQIAKCMQVEGTASGLRNGSAEESQQVKVGRAGLCAFWLRGQHSSDMLSRLTEQLMADLLQVEASTPAEQRVEFDANAVYDVLHQVPGGSHSALFVEFFQVWRQQRQLLAGYPNLDPKTIGDKVLEVFLTVLPHEYWFLMFRQILPLLRHPWSGRVFDVNGTYMLMQHLDKAIRSAQFSSHLYSAAESQYPNAGSGLCDATPAAADKIRYALSENLSEASICVAQY